MTQIEHARLRARVPAHILGALDRWQGEGIWPGGCCSNLLAGDVFIALPSMDPTVREALYDILNYIALCMPRACRGDQMTEWALAHLPDELRA